MNEEQAKIVALQALTYLVGEPSALQRFFDLSGVDGADLRRRADDPVMLAGVLDFFLGDEAQLLEMCQATDMAGETPARARRGLPGGQGDEWS
ncbi:MAG: DUF3572 domain-containing protein [Alphaproteobacteria bacterium]|nr:DUF3572 domain-containing protein [Alphaproteobacteria bacterium]